MAAIAFPGDRPPPHPAMAIPVGACDSPEGDHSCPDMTSLV
jgi:hypothetical protein